MEGTTDIGLIFGSRVRLHYTWLLVLALIAAVMVTQFPEAYPLWQRAVFGGITGILFFMAIVIRQFSLGLVSLSRGSPMKVITLFPFGGISDTIEATTSPAVERLLVVVGLLSNLIISMLFYGIHLILVKAGDVIATGFVQWLAFIYFMLTILHFVPCFPLDGGRLLRAFLWQTTDNYERATRISSRVSWSMGWLFIIGGIILLVLTTQWFTGLLLALIGWVLLSAATQSRHQAQLGETLKGIKARDLMERECPPVNPQLNLSQLVHDCILVTAQRYFMVFDDTKIQGIITLNDIKRVPKRRWPSTSVGEIMTPPDELRMANAEQPAASVLEQMDEWRTDYMPVLENGELIGVIARESLMRVGRARAELGL